MAEKKCIVAYDMENGITYIGLDEYPEHPNELSKVITVETKQLACYSDPISALASRYATAHTNKLLHPKRSTINFRKVVAHHEMADSLEELMKKYNGEER